MLKAERPTSHLRSRPQAWGTVSEHHPALLVAPARKRVAQEDEQHV